MSSRTAVSPVRLATIVGSSPDASLSDIVQCAQLAEQLGYESFWLTEDNVRDSFLVLGRVAQATRRIRLGTGITSIYARTPTTLAMTAATLQDLSGGRFFLGLGTGGPGFVARGHGLPVDSPIRRMRETVHIVRGLLKDERMTYTGRFFKIRGFHLRHPSTPPVPIYLGALNRRMTRLAGELADGVVANFMTPERFDTFVKPWLREGHQRAMDERPPPLVATLALTPADPDSQDAMDALRRRVAFYGSSSHYRHTFETSGFADEVGAISERWSSGDRDGAVEHVTQRMAETLTLSGSVDRVVARLRAYGERDILTVVYPVTRRGRFLSDYERAIRTIASLGRAATGATVPSSQEQAASSREPPP